MSGRENTGKPTYIVHEATRAAQIPGVGSFGSGFLSNPAEIVRKLQTYGISLVDVE